MQLNTMDCSSRSNNIERDSDLGDDLSHDDHSDDEMRECDSIDGDHVIGANSLGRSAGRLNSSMASSGGDMSFTGAGGSGSGGVRTPDHQTEMQMGHHHQFPPNHPLGALGNFMGIGGLHGLSNLQQHNDVLEKLKMQVRDMKVGLMEQDYAAAHAAAFGSNVLPTPINTAFSLPPTTISSFGHSQNLAAAANSVANGALSGQNSSVSATSSALTNGSSFAFTSPTAPSTKDVNPASNSSTSSEASNSSQQNNGWSFEEQYKQVRQLYEINDDPKRKEFLDDLFSFMQKRGTPINRLPIMAKSVLDLYELYNLVIARGGLVDVINKKLWQEIIKGLHLPSSITSAAFTLRTQYMKYLYPYECEKKNLSSPAELQAAIDGNRREGRRSSYGQFEAMHNQLQIPQSMRQSLPGAMQQMSPLALVTHAAAQNGPTAQSAVAAAVAHHRLMGPTFTQVPNLMAHEIEQRMMEYLKIIQGGKKEPTPTQMQQQHQHQHQQQQQQQHQQQQHQQQQQQQQHQQRQRSQSPEITTREALNALEMSRVALWQMYHNNTSPPSSVNTSPQGVAVGGAGAGIVNGVEPQRSEALNLSESPSPSLTTIKREREREPSPEQVDRDDFHHLPPPAKRGIASGSGGIVPNFYLPPGMTNVNFQHSMQHDSDGEHDAEDDDVDEEEAASGDHNTTANSSTDENERRHVNGHHHHLEHHLQQQQHQQQQAYQHLHHHHSNHHNDKSDDSAIESSPTTSASAGNGHISPVSTKKIHLSKQQQRGGSSDEVNATHGSPNVSISPLEQLSLLSGMQFRVSRNETGANGEQQLIVNLELNGIKYSGVLIANEAPADGKQEPKLEAGSAAAITSRTNVGATTAEAAKNTATSATTAATNPTTTTTTTTTTTVDDTETVAAATTTATSSSSSLKLTNGPSSVLKESLMAS